MRAKIFSHNSQTGTPTTRGNLLTAMPKSFATQNQHGHYLNKQKEWTDGRDRRTVFRCTDKVDAINLVFELSSKDTELRANYLECEVDDFGNPQVDASYIPLPSVNSDGEAGDSEDNAQDSSQDNTPDNTEPLENPADHPNISAYQG